MIKQTLQLLPDFFLMFDHFVDTKRYMVKRNYTGIRLKSQVLTKYFEDNLRQIIQTNVSGCPAQLYIVFVLNYRRKNLVSTIAAIMSLLDNKKYHCMKTIQIRSFFFLYQKIQEYFILLLYPITCGLEHIRKVPLYYHLQCVSGNISSSFLYVSSL